MPGCTSNGDRHKFHTRSLSGDNRSFVPSVHGDRTHDSLEVPASYPSDTSAVPQQANDLPLCQPLVRLVVEGFSLPKYRPGIPSIFKPHV